jgi:hypothetical protein
MECRTASRLSASSSAHCVPTRNIRERKAAAARLLGLRVLIPSEARMSVPSKCCVLSGRGLYVGLITRTEESYRVVCV